MEQTNSRWFYIFILMSLMSVLFCPAARAEASWLGYFRKDSLLNTYKRCYAVIEDSLWVGTYGSGILVKSASGQKYLTPQSTKSAAGLNDGLISENINCISFDKKEQRAWVGTPCGISSCSLNGEAWASYTTKDGLPNDVIRAIAIDEQGVVWAATPSGLAVFNGEGFNRVEGSDGFSIHTIKADGDSIWVGCVSGEVMRYKNGQWQSFAMLD